MTGRGDCYKAAAEHVLYVDRTALVCHGTVTGQGPIAGLRYGHAWTESADGTTVVDTSEGRRIELPRDAYYAIGRIDPADVRRYRHADVVDATLGYGHWGPWDDDAVETVQ